MTLANAGKQRTPESTVSRAHDRMKSAEVLLLLVIKGIFMYSRSHRLYTFLT
jgi:hypothetical protein